MRGTRDEVVHRARAVAGWLWWTAWGALGVACVGTSLVAPVGDGLTWFVLGIGIYAITWWIPLTVAVLTVWSVNFFGSLTLTRTTLRVGRDRLPVADLDPAGVRVVHLSEPYVGRRRRPLEGEEPPVRTGTPLPRLTSVHHLGGAYATPMGMDSVTLPLRDGTGVRVDVRDREALLAALVSVLPDR